MCTSQRFLPSAFTAAFLACLFVAPRRAQADDWDRVLQLRTGERLRIQLREASRVLGTLESVRSDGLTISIHGTHSVATRESVRRIDRDRAVPRTLPWLGMTIGAIWMGSQVAQEGDFTAFGRAMWTGIGAGIGGLIGAGVRRASRFEPVYRADTPTLPSVVSSPVPEEGVVIPDAWAVPSHTLAGRVRETSAPTSAAANHDRAPSDHLRHVLTAQGGEGLAPCATTVALEANVTTAVHDLELEAAGSVDGVVVDALGQPIAKIRVSKLAIPAMCVIGRFFRICSGDDR